MNYDYLFKLLIIGDKFVGKSSLCNRLNGNIYNNDYNHTVGIEFSTTFTNVCDKLIKSQLWDTSGRKEYLPLIKSYYKGIVGVILMYSVDDPVSFKKIPFWLNEIKINKKEHEEVTIFLVGNKKDKSRIISFNDGESMAKKYNLLFMEISAKNDENCSILIKKLCTHILSKYNPTVGHSGVRKPPHLDLTIKHYDNQENTYDCCCCC